MKYFLLSSILDHQIRYITFCNNWLELKSFKGWDQISSNKVETIKCILIDDFTPCCKLMNKETWEWFLESCWDKEVLFYISTFQLCTHVVIKCLIFVIRKKASREIEIIDYENYNHSSNSFEKLLMNIDYKSIEFWR